MGDAVVFVPHGGGVVHKPGLCRCGRYSLAVAILGLLALSSVFSLSYNVGDSPVGAGARLGPVGLGVIPNRLVFVYPVDLLAAAPRSKAEEVLAANMRHTVEVFTHTGSEDVPPPQVVVYDNARCEEVVGRVASATLAARYAALRVPASKRDICRGAALYDAGGIMFEPDLRARFDMRRLLHPGIEFSAVLESVKPPAKTWYSHILPSMSATASGAIHTWDGSMDAGAGAGDTATTATTTTTAAAAAEAVGHVGATRRFVPSFVAAAPGHPVMATYLGYLEGLGDLGQDDAYVPHMGSALLYKAYDAWSAEEPEEVAVASKLFREGWLDTWYQAGSVLGGLLSHVERQAAGSGCCCNVVVYDPESYNAPFFLHAVGSQGCASPTSRLRLGKQWWK